MEKKENKKSIRNLSIFFILIFITFYIIFKDQDISEIIKIVRNADLKFIFVGIRIYGCLFFL